MVEKHRKCSLKCNSPIYLLPLSLDFSPDVIGPATEDEGSGRNSSALISCRGF